MSFPHLIPVDNCPEIVCPLGDVHYLHVGVLALGGRNQHIGIATAEERIETRMPLPVFIKGPWQLNERQSVLRLRGAADPSDIDLLLLGKFAGKYDIHLGFTFPPIEQTEVTFPQREIEVPYNHGDGHIITFQTNSESFMTATARALGIARIASCN